MVPIRLELVTMAGGALSRQLPHLGDGTVEQDLPMLCWVNSLWLVASARGGDLALQVGSGAPLYSDPRCIYCYVPAAISHSLKAQSGSVKEYGTRSDDLESLVPGHPRSTSTQPTKFRSTRHPDTGTVTLFKTYMSTGSYPAAGERADQNPIVLWHTIRNFPFMGDTVCLVCSTRRIGPDK